MASNKTSRGRTQASRSADQRSRCAIYTRKSTEEGLDQQFNSLDAQREACAAYILSQQHEGWDLLPACYDDGGFSGGSMNRPALTQLLADVQAGTIDVIVVYKVDRLTRSLADFAKIVEILDDAGASFVSVTQAFNTTNSMGRLTLNVLLSFAQFEREVTGERIRDKIAASKARGMWMGGPVPLGYDADGRTLVINESEAEVVRQIFALHQDVPTLRALSQELERQGIRSKVRTLRDGRSVGGVPYSSGALRHILRSRLYLGEISHRERVYAGTHQAIVERKVWAASQARLSAPRPRTGIVSPLAGRIVDGSGNKLYPAHANKGGRRYRYYVSGPRTSGETWRLPAGDLEVMVWRSLAELFSNAPRVVAELGGRSNRKEVAARGRQVLTGHQGLGNLQELFEQIDGSVVITEASVRIVIDRRQLAATFGISPSSDSLNEPIELDVPASLRRRGQELRLVYAAPDLRPGLRDDRLIDLIGKGWAAWAHLSEQPRIADAAKRSHFTRLARLRFLAPDITTAILDGRQPADLTARKLLRMSELPIDWADQRRALGFD